ncbi:MAG: TIM barrel protein [Phycisphaerae bacterium]|nr:TIM barrel protein [Phycisphaerae bacterium]HON91565.1 TIM barrel protein [Sedimentisphaerales bacterium]
MAGEYRFSFGPWNVHEGADPFGPTVRHSISFAKKLKMYKQLGFDGVQFHDDDAVPDMNKLTAREIIKKAKEVRRMLKDEGLTAEFVAPRLWEDPRTIDGGYTSNDPACRQYAKDRSRRCIDIAVALDCDLIVLWLAREGTYIREAKDSKVAVDRLVEAINDMLAYHDGIRIAIEPKPNEPMDHAYIPTTGHALALAYKTKDPKRVGVNIETAHAILAGLDPSDEMGFALAYNKLYTVHLNDQNGLKFDQDKSFGSVDLRRAFNQVRILDKYNYGAKGEFVGLDVKAMRTQKIENSTKHLRNSREIYLNLVDLVRSLDEDRVEQLIADRDYEELDLLIVNHLMGR